MGPLTLAAIGNLTTALDNLSANLPTGDSNDADDAALIDAQTARVEALTPAAPVVPVVSSGPLGSLSVRDIQTTPAPSPVVPGALPGQS